MISIVVPVFNEEKTILEVLDKLQKAFEDIPHEIIVVDDGSTDKTPSLCSGHEYIRYIRLFENHGKGYAVRTGFAKAKGEFLAVQDADLEYDPRTLRMLYTHAKKGMVVYGKRDRKKGYFVNRLANALLSFTCNVLYGSKLFDIYTGYKIIPREIFESCTLTSTGFEFEAEITAKLLKNQVQIVEIPVEYEPRTFKDGKHIRARDGLVGLWTLIGNRF